MDSQSPGWERGATPGQLGRDRLRGPGAGQGPAAVAHLHDRTPPRARSRTSVRRKATTTVRQRVPHFHDNFGLKAGLRALPAGLSYRVCYRPGMAQREKRSISLPPPLAEAIDAAALVAGTTFSGWLADAATRRLRLDAGRQGLAEWEHEHGSLTPAELAEGHARARAALGRKPASRSARRSA